MGRLLLTTPSRYVPQKMSQMRQQHMKFVEETFLKRLTAMKLQRILNDTHPFIVLFFQLYQHMGIATKDSTPSRLDHVLQLASAVLDELQKSAIGRTYRFQLFKKICEFIGVFLDHTYPSFRDREQVKYVIYGFFLYNLFTSRRGSIFPDGQQKAEDIRRVLKQWYPSVPNKQIEINALTDRLQTLETMTTPRQQAAPTSVLPFKTFFRNAVQNEIIQRGGPSKIEFPDAVSMERYP